VRYLPLDRLTARARAGPSGTPGLGLCSLRPGLLSLPPGSAGAVALSAGCRTHYLATPTPDDADAWVDAIAGAWTAAIADGGPRDLLMNTAATTGAGLEPATSTAAAATAASASWATAAAEPPASPAGTPREDGYSTPPVRAWR